MTDPGARTSTELLERAEGSARDSAWLDLCWRAVSAEKRKLYPAVETILNQRVAPPDAIVSSTDRYRYHTIRALLSEASGRPADARRHARDALVVKATEGKGFRFRPRAALVQDADAGLDARLVKLAE